MKGDINLWQRILDFDLDQPFSEYGFSTRLAKENYWTINFTEKAILEYKKFMYLAATSDMMVSPSEIVDVVWHQHLVFTQSYADFCTVLGKSIQHVPSTHNRAEAEKFRLAKERTQKLYQEVFGEQPSEIWQYQDMFASLRLPKARMKIRSLILLAILVFVLLVGPVYFLLRPVYIRIQNPDFIQYYLGIILCGFALLEFCNRFLLIRIVRSFPEHAFIKNLHPYEVLYLQAGRLDKVMHGVFNRYVSEEKIVARKNKTLEWAAPSAPGSPEEFTIIDTFERVKGASYVDLAYRASTRPVFTNISYSMDAFKKYFCKSVAFGKLFQTNLFAIGIMLLIGFERLVMGTVRGRPTDLIAITMLGILVISIWYLSRLLRLVASQVSAYYYSKYNPLTVKSESLDWQYLILGSAVLLPSFVPSVNDADSKATWGSGDGGSSDSGSAGSSCGSSCSSCGGCGGGD